MDGRRPDFYNNDDEDYLYYDYLPYCNKRRQKPDFNGVRL